MKKILIPTDFSKYSDFALSVGVGLAKKSNSELFLLHLERVMSPVAITGNPEEEYIRLSRNKLFELAERTEKLGIRVHTIFVEDQGLDALEDYIEPYGIDLIVMGSHGQSGIVDLFIGSNTKKLIRKVEVPVLVIKAPLNADLNFGNILFASNFRQPLNQPLQFLNELSRLFEANVHFLFLNMFYHLIVEQQALKIMDDYLVAFKGLMVTKSVVETNDEILAISEFLKRKKVDLVVLSNEHIGLPARWVHASLAERFIQSSDLPSLILPARIRF